MPSTASVRFLSVSNQHGTATLTFVGWDATQGTPGHLISIAGIGGISPFSSLIASTSLTVSAVNHAATWTGSSSLLTPVLPNTPPTGQTVASVFAGNFSDIDGNGVGIAITALTGAANGSWQYSLDGINWISIGNVSMSSALLLSGGDYIRFVPKANFLGTATLTALAWDGTTGGVGGTVNLSSTNATGGNTAFSATALTATILVNSAPTLT